jgi:hypothetical protein
MAPPVARCLCEGHLCQTAASGARAFARVLRGFERIDRFADEHGYAQASFSTPAGNGTGLAKINRD